MPSIPVGYGFTAIIVAFLAVSLGVGLAVACFADIRFVAADAKLTTAHGPLALQEILLAGCPTVGVRTGASFVRTGETGVVVDRPPPRRQRAESDDDVRALVVFMEAIEQAQSLDRHSVRGRAAEEFDTDRIVDSIICARGDRDGHTNRIS